MLRVIICSIGLTIFSAYSYATTLMYQSFDHLVSKSEGIIEATVDSVETIPDANGNPFTFITFTDVDVIDGAYQDVLFTLRLEGGEQDGVFSGVVGTPEFTLGERVIMFVRGNGKHTIPLVGWEQGLFRIDNDTSEILDSAGNKVVNEKDGHLIKRGGHETAAEIVNVIPGRNFGRSHSPMGKIEVIEGDLPSDKTETTDKNVAGMKRPAFVNLIKARVKKMQDKKLQHAAFRSANKSFNTEHYQHSEERSRDRTPNGKAPALTEDQLNQIGNPKIPNPQRENVPNHIDQ